MIAAQKKLRQALPCRSWSSKWLQNCGPIAIATLEATTQLRDSRAFVLLPSLELLNFVRGFPLGRCMSISNCIAQLLAFVPCRLEHATYRSHEAKMVSGPSIHEDGALPSQSPCVQPARSIMVKHSGIPSKAPLMLNSPKKTDTYDDACPYGKHVAAVRWPAQAHGAT